MEEYQERAVQEYKELEERISKLEVFQGTHAWRVLPSDEAADMYEQCRIMKQYSAVLLKRIKRWES
jgi:hypothetical protein